MSSVGVTKCDLKYSDERVGRAQATGQSLSQSVGPLMGFCMKRKCFGSFWLCKITNTVIILKFPSFLS